MFIKLAVLTAVVALAWSQEHQQHQHHSHTPAHSAQYIIRHDGPAEPVYDKHKHVVDYHAHPKYEYKYEVEDKHTGDIKYQHESRDGDVVKGVYSLHDADGSVRTVEYHSDKKTGFNTAVKHSTKHIVPEKHHH